MEIPQPLLALRKAGYSPFTDPVTGDESFVLRLTTEYYPRFHVYIEEERGNTVISLHLDQKKPSYGSGHAHGGEYDGPVIEKEMMRIDGWVKAAQADAVAEASVSSAPVKNTSWWKFWA